MAQRSRDSQLNHDRWVAVIAREHFAFPNDFQPNWEAITNPGEERNIGIVLKDRSIACPDIVVRDRLAGPGTNDAMLIAEIETEDTVNDAEAEQWRQFGSSDCNFYLYVPRGSGKKALKLLESTRARGVYEYNEDRNGNVQLDLII
jgi:hypothetical protein